jgi:ectoine hydroxylase-related dioxygenase (phytanoyl-CoA dioxygenase family)
MQTAQQQVPFTFAPATQHFSTEELARIKREFAETGYVVFKDVVSKPKLAHLRQRLAEEFERVKTTGELFAGGGLLTGHLNCFPGAESRVVYDELVERGIIGLVKELYPKAERMPNVGMNYNLPRSVAQHYHADRPFTREFIIVNIAVVDTEIANGAIDLLPGTNRKFYPFWKFIVERANRLTTRVPMQQGDILIRSSNLWHRGMPNLTETPRPMMALTWEDGGSIEPDPFQRDNGKITFKPNWYRPDFLGRLRERTFITAPVTYDAYRFVDSILTNKGYQ